MPDFDAFRTELEDVCRKHGVYLGPTDAGGIGVWSRDAGVAPSRTLVGCITAEQAPKAECAGLEKAPLAKGKRLFLRDGQRSRLSRFSRGVGLAPMTVCAALIGIAISTAALVVKLVEWLA